jgi:hypothetical protein
LGAFGLSSILVGEHPPEPRVPNEGDPRAKDDKKQSKARREYLKTAGAVGMTAPAVALLMSAKPKKALAVTSEVQTVRLSTRPL